MKFHSKQKVKIRYIRVNEIVYDLSKINLYDQNQDFKLMNYNHFGILKTSNFINVNETLIKTSMNNSFRIAIEFFLIAKRKKKIILYYENKDR